MGYCDEAYNKFLEELTVIECDGGWCHKGSPYRVYKTKEDAENAAQLLADMVTIH